MPVIKLTPDQRLAGADLLADPRLKRALGVLNPHGEETRVVGGAVRNALLALPPGDVDLATTLVPDAVQMLAKAARLRSIPTGIEHGTVTLVVEGLPLEVTTLRQDVSTDGRHAVVRFGRDFAADAQRRDFSINALSLSPDGRVFDTVGGIADLAAGRVRFIGDARTRIREDYLRILRFFRFHAAYGRGPLDPPGLHAAARERDGLSRLSRERIRAELFKLLVAPQAGPSLHAMAEVGILPLVLGDAGDVEAFDREARRVGRPDAVLRLAALGVRSEADVTRLRERLRLTNAERKRLSALLDASAELQHLPDGPGLRRLLFEHGPEAAMDALLHGAAARTPPGDDRAWRAAADQLRPMPRPVLPWTGDDLKAGGLSGPGIGAGLTELARRWSAEDFPDREADLRRLFEEVVAAMPTQSDE